MTDKTRKTIAKRIHDTRIKLDMTQSDVAEKAGITTNYFARIERADVNPSMEVILSIIKALGVTSKDILDV